jgi:hypothetical protein
MSLDGKRPAQIGQPALDLGGEGVPIARSARSAFARNSARGAGASIIGCPLSGPASVVLTAMSGLAGLAAMSVGLAAVGYASRAILAGALGCVCFGLDREPGDASEFSPPALPPARKFDRRRR